MSKNQEFDLKLERYLLGELPSSEMRRIDEALKHNADLRGKLEALRRETDEYFQKYPKMRTQAASRAAEQTPWWKLFYSPRIIGGFAFAAAVVALIFFLPKPAPENKTITSDPKGDNVIIALKHDSAENGVRTKGNPPALFLSVVRKAQKIMVADGEAVHPGEEIQIAYRASGHRYGIIVSVDNARAVTLHYPETEGASQVLRSGNQVALPLAFRLDEKPGFENFYFLASDKPLPMKRIMRELAQTGNIHKSIDAGVVRTVMRLKKE